MTNAGQQFVQIFAAQVIGQHFGISSVMLLQQGKLKVFLALAARDVDSLFSWRQA